MRTIKLVETQDAREEVAKGAFTKGFQLSIRKWEAIQSALSTISTIVDSQCGLCVASGFMEPEQLECPLKRNCSWGSNTPVCTKEWRAVQKAIMQAHDRAGDMLDSIRKAQSERY